LRDSLFRFFLAARNVINVPKNYYVNSDKKGLFRFLVEPAANGFKELLWQSRRCEKVQKTMLP